jgi:hypothetical protein
VTEVLCRQKDSAQEDEAEGGFFQRIADFAKAKPPRNPNQRQLGYTLSKAERYMVINSVLRNGCILMDDGYESLRRRIYKRIKLISCLLMKDSLEELAPIRVHYRAFQHVKELIQEKHGVLIHSFDDIKFYKHTEIDEKSLSEPGNERIHKLPMKTMRYCQ